MDRAEWLAERRKGLGASDIAAVLGMSPFKSAWQVYAEKVSGYQRTASEGMMWGLRLEQAIADAFRDETGWGSMLPPLPLYWHQSCPWMSCTPDRLIPETGSPIELKNVRTADGWGSSGTDEVPDHYALQVHHQMAVLDAEEGFLAVLIAGQEFRHYHIPRSKRIEERLIQVGRDFWGRVEARDEPAPDWSDPRAMEIWDCLHPPRAEVTVDLGADAANLVNVLEVHKSHKAAAERLIEEVKAELAQMMGDAALGRLPDGRTVVRQVIRRGEYTVNATEYVTLSVRQPRKGK